MSAPTSMSRAELLNEARGWLGTPYRHQASCKGAGADCLGLIRGLYRAGMGAEPEAPPPYTPDWGEAAGGARESLLEAARRHLLEKEREAMRPGDVLLFRVMERGPIKHCSVLSGEGRMIHAYSGRAVCETVLGPYWRARLTHVFAFPFIGE